MESFDIREQIADDIFMDNRITVKVNNNDNHNSSNGVLEIKFPRNFPYNNSIRSGDAGLLSFSFLDNDGRGIEGDDRMATECFFVFSISFTGSSIVIETGTASILIKSPYQGDIIPDSCIPQTVVEDIPTREDDGTIDCTAASI
jgi:hypothetical protein